MERDRSPKKSRSSAKLTTSSTGSAAVDKAELIKFAKKLYQTETLDDKVLGQINGLARFPGTTHLSAIQSLQQTFKQKQAEETGGNIYTGIKQKEDTAVNSLDVWLAAEESAPLVTKNVEMGGVDSTGGDAKQYILWTTSLGGCLGVAAFSGGKAFLAHYMPTQLATAELVLGHINWIKDKVGADATITLSSPTTDAPYLTLFLEGIKMHAPRFTVIGNVANKRLAINAKTGATMIDFRTEGLPTN